MRRDFMKTYIKPVLEIDNNIAEGVYAAASGATGGNSTVSVSSNWDISSQTLTCYVNWTATSGSFILYITYSQPPKTSSCTPYIQWAYDKGAYTMRYPIDCSNGTSATINTKFSGYYDNVSISSWSYS